MIQCIEAPEDEEIFDRMIRVFKKMVRHSTQENFGPVLDNGNWERLLNLLPEHLTEQPVSARTNTLLDIFASFPFLVACQFEYFNALLHRFLNYLRDPITYHTHHMYCCLEQCFRYQDHQNLVELNYLEIYERLLEAIKSAAITNDIDSFLSALNAWVVCMLDPFSNIREVKCVKDLLEVCFAVIESQAMESEYENSLISTILLIAGSHDELAQKLCERDNFAVCLCRILTKESCELEPFMNISMMHTKLGVQWFMKFNFMDAVVAKLLEATKQTEGNCDVILFSLRQLLKEAENLVVQGGEILYNPVALQIEARGGINILNKLVDRHMLAENINEIYFGDAWQNYLARRRGLKTKKAS